MTVIQTPSNVAEVENMWVEISSESCALGPFIAGYESSEVIYLLFCFKTNFNELNHEWQELK